MSFQSESGLAWSDLKERFNARANYTVAHLIRCVSSPEVMETYGSSVQKGWSQPVDTNPVVLRTSDAALALKKRNGYDRT